MSHEIPAIMGDSSSISPDGRRLIERVLLRKDEVARQIVSAVRNEVADYGSLASLTMSSDVLEIATLTLTDMMGSLLGDQLSATELADRIQRSASRRVHQDISLASLLHSYRIWGAQVWQAVLDEAGDDSAMRDAALGLVHGIFSYVDMVSIALAQVYMEESVGIYRAPDVLRSDVLESLLLGRALSDRARIEIARINPTGDSKVVVVILRPHGIPPERLRSESLETLRSCRQALASGSRALLGIRDSDVVCLIRVGARLDYERVMEAAHSLAGQSPEWKICVGRPHDGLQGIQRSFHEAQEAATVAASLHPHGRAVLFSEVILDRILVRSEYGQDLLEEALGPLMTYDAEHSADLIPTLRAYVANDLNMTRTAKDLHVNPNTVAYRVKRIGQLTHQDPTTSLGIATLTIALRLLDG